MRAGIFNWFVNVLRKLRKDRDISMQRQCYYKKCGFEFHVFNILLLTPGLSTLSNRISLFDNS